MRPLLVLTSLFCLLSQAPLLSDTVDVSTLDLTKVRQSWGSAQVDKSQDGKPLTIAGASFAKGYGTNSNSRLIIDLGKSATRFTALVGVDDDVNGNPKSSVEFIVSADGKVLFRSGVMRAGNPAKAVDVDLTGASTLQLVVSDAGDGIDYDHGDWGNPLIQGDATAVKAVDGAPAVAVGILTPPPAPTPRINGPKVFGVRPGSPFLFTVRATGTRPMRFSATGLPPQLALDPNSGQITGTLPEAAEYDVVLHAQNALGVAAKPLHIVVGSHIQLTPPMGWNSWNCFGNTVSQEKVQGAAQVLVSTGLADHGWTYVNIDDGWQGVRGGDFNGIQPNKKFPDMKALSDAIHGMGLKFGIYSTPWQGSYEGHIGGSCNDENGVYDWIVNHQCNEFYRYAVGPSAHYNMGKYSFAPEDARQYAAWGVDYLKYDWNPIDVDHTQVMSEELRKQNRDIVFSLSNDADPAHGADWARLANCWRTTGDIRDTWGSISGIGFTRERWAKFEGPGHYNDPDMLVVGSVGWSGHAEPSHLTQDEQYTHISLWCLLGAPLLIGCDLSQIDPFTLGLLTNDEVLDVDQDSLCKQATALPKSSDGAVYVKPLDDGSLAVGLFNKGPIDQTVTAAWSDLGLNGPMKVRDLWRQKDLGTMSDKLEAPVASHGVLLVRISPVGAP